MFSLSHGLHKYSICERVQPLCRWILWGRDVDPRNGRMHNLRCRHILVLSWSCILFHLCGWLSDRHAQPAGRNDMHSMYCWKIYFQLASILSRLCGWHILVSWSCILFQLCGWLSNQHGHCSGRHLMFSLSHGLHKYSICERVQPLCRWILWGRDVDPRIGVRNLCSRKIRSRTDLSGDNLLYMR